MSGLVDELSASFVEWCSSEGTPATTIRRRACTLRSVGNAGAASREELKAWWTTRSDKQPAIGKGSKARRIAIADGVLAQLGPRRGGDVSVVTGTAEVLTTGALGGRVNRAMLAAGVPATFHKLRHRAGTAAYQATKDLVAVRTFLGHVSITTTTVYAAAADDAARQIAAAL